MGRKAKIRLHRRLERLVPVRGDWVSALSQGCENLASIAEFDAKAEKWDCVYWHNDYSVEYSGLTLLDTFDSCGYSIDFDWDEDLGDRSQVVKQLISALFTGEASFGDEDLGISVCWGG